MRIIADLHIHSRFARATSKYLSIPEIAKWANIKGINLIGTGDFTHPKWFAEIEEYLTINANGFYSLKSGEYPEVFFVPQAEIASIYTQGGKCRRIHTIVIMPTLKSVKKFNEMLGTRANLYSDGRPITGVPAKYIAKMAIEADPKSLIVPAHIWTPWFAVLGSKSGFDSIEECFEEEAKNIYAVETGISSDLMMNWQLSMLDKFTLLSNSDAHSVANLGREANVFEISENDFSCDEIFRIIKEKDASKFKYTIEYFPDEGMYHYDGHRACGEGIRMAPEESKKINKICPVCGKEMTIGVMHRVMDLADRKYGFVPNGATGQKKFMPLDEIISKSIGKGEKTKTVQEIYNKFIDKFGAEYPLLLDTDIIELKKVDERVGEAILKVRKGELKIEPGYDGTYGVVEIR
ncbi:MAG: endonuclease Q family protein [Patescibacteria group bacterium]|jgi:uncharacterized protein (TIGR00375 family)